MQSLKRASYPLSRGIIKDVKQTHTHIVIGVANLNYFLNDNCIQADYFNVKPIFSLASLVFTYRSCIDPFNSCFDTLEASANLV